MSQPWMSNLSETNPTSLEKTPTFKRSDLIQLQRLEISKRTSIISALGALVQATPPLERGVPLGLPDPECEALQLKHTLESEEDLP